MLQMFEGINVHLYLSNIFCIQEYTGTEVAN